VFRVRSALSEAYCLQLADGKNRDAANIRLWKKSKSKSEKFVFVKVDAVSAPAETPAIADGIYRIGSALSSSLALAIPDNSAENGVVPALAPKSNALSQLFIFTYEDGYYKIRSLVSGKSLTVRAGSVLAKAGAEQSTDKAKPQQRFTLVQKSGGTYQFLAKVGGLALRVAAGSASSGQTLETYYPSSAKSQRFTLTAVSGVKLSSDVYTLSPYAKNELNLCIEGASKSAGARPSVANDARSFSQKFRVARKADGSYSLMNVNSQLLLTASESSVVQMKAAAGGPTDDQLWYADLSVGGMRFVSKSTGLAMQLTGDEGSYGVELAAPAESTKQAFLPDRTGLFDRGRYRIDSRAGAGSLEVEDASFDDYTDILLGAADGSGKQAWYVETNGDGAVTIRSGRAGKPIEVDGPEGGAGVVQNKSSGGEEQQWVLEESGGGWYTLRSVWGETYLESDEETGDGTVRTTSGAVTAGVPNNMEWRFVPVKVKDPGPAMPKAVADEVIAEAKKHLGKKYVFGAEGPNTFDCSGFIYYVMNQSGVKEMSRVTAQDIYDLCVKLPASEAKRGDLIFFKNTYKTDRIVTHLGICLGGGKMIHAGSPVQISKFNTKYFKAHFYAYARIA
jgi:hypothetical protein